MLNNKITKFMDDYIDKDETLNDTHYNNILAIKTTSYLAIILSILLSLVSIFIFIKIIFLNILSTNNIFTLFIVLLFILFILYIIFLCGYLSLKHLKSMLNNKK